MQQFRHRKPHAIGPSRVISSFAAQFPTSILPEAMQMARESFGGNISSGAALNTQKSGRASPANSLIDRIDTPFVGSTNTLEEDDDGG